MFSKYLKWFREYLGSQQAVNVNIIRFTKLDFLGVTGLEKELSRGCNRSTRSQYISPN